MSSQKFSAPAISSKDCMPRSFLRTKSALRVAFGALGTDVMWSTMVAAVVWPLSPLQTSWAIRMLQVAKCCKEGPSGVQDWLGCCYMPWTLLCMPKLNNVAVVRVASLLLRSSFPTPGSHRKACSLPFSRWFRHYPCQVLLGTSGTHQYRCPRTRGWSLQQKSSSQSHLPPTWGRVVDQASLSPSFWSMDTSLCLFLLLLLCLSCGEGRVVVRDVEGLNWEYVKNC